MVCDDVFSLCDILIIIGGDGTIIHNAKLAAVASKPVLGVNTGRIGYLAGVESSDLNAISSLFCGGYKIEERIMLEITHLKDNEKNDYIAFNDAVISKGNLSRLIDINLNLEGTNIKYRADGLILATPTGSTAYSMSAGGPVVHPLVENIVVTPICPYSYFTKSLVLPKDTEISVSVDAIENKQAYLTIDGEIAVEINPNDEISAKICETKVKLININSESIYNCLERKNK